MRFYILIPLATLLACSTSKESTTNEQAEYGQTIRLTNFSGDSSSASVQQRIESLLAEEPPILIGGLPGLNVSYPERARRRGVQGRVMLSFIVTPAGKAENIEVVSGIGHGCDRAAIRAVKRAKFIPGKDSNGNPVTSIMGLPINFRLGM